MVERVEVRVVPGAVGQADVDRRGRLVEGVVALLVQRQRERVGVAGEDRRGAVAMVHVEVHDRDPAHLAARAQRPRGDGHVVHQAEALAVVGERVVEAAAERHRAAVDARAARGLQGGARGQPGGLDERARPGHLHPGVLGGREVAVLQLAHVVGGVDAPHVLVAGGTRRHEVAVVRGSGLEQAVAHLAVLLGGEDVGAEVHGERRMEDQAEGQHRADCRGCGGSARAGRR